MVMKAEIGRFDGEMKLIHFSSGDIVSDLLAKAGLSLGSGEGINNGNGEKVELDNDAIDGEVYYIVGNYKQGC